MKAIQFLPLLVVLALAACGKKEAPVEPVAAAPSAAASAPAPAPATPVAAPAAAPAPAAAAPSAADLAMGEKVYTATCLACHGAAVLGAPKLGDKAAWGPRLAQGKDLIYTNAINGLKMMPPRGGNAALKDEELKAAVDYMLSKAN